MSKTTSNTDFFNHLAGDYDLMIPFAKAVERKQNFMRNIITPEMKNAADIGCGTGTDSISLARLGLNVTAFDPSSGMIGKANNNAIKEKVKVNFLVSDASNIPEKFNESFDIVISFGNTFANIEKEELHRSLKRCYEILKKNGVLYIHILNYNKILAEKERIVNITEDDKFLFVRFYDFYPEFIVFNLLKAVKTNLSEHSLISTKVYPHLKEDFEKLLSKLNFKSIKFYSDLKLNLFNESSSKDLVMHCTK